MTQLRLFGSIGFAMCIAAALAFAQVALFAHDSYGRRPSHASSAVGARGNAGFNDTTSPANVNSELGKSGRVSPAVAGGR